MDMDDPWGSPWAEEFQHPIPIPNAKGGVDGLNLAPLTTGKDGVPRETTDSPWDVPADEFGDWAELPGEQDIRGSGEGLDGVGGGWEVREDKDLTKNEKRGLSPRWGEPQAISDDGIPRLSPGLLPKPEEILRQPSPDPWATVTALSDGDHKEKGEEKQSQDTDIGSESTLHVEPPNASGVDKDGEPLPETNDSMPEKDGGDGAIVQDSLVDGSNDAKLPTEVAEQSPTGKEVDESSRPSTSPSDHSQHDEVPSESPRTSLDEEPKHSQATRHVSSKIQELVEHFDGLAKAQIEEPVGVRGSESSGREDGVEEPLNPEGIRLDVGTEVAEKDKGDSNEEEDDDDDFGDFEDGQSEISEHIAEVKYQAVAIGPANDELANKPLEGPKDLGALAANARPIRAPEKKFGRVEFDIDMSAVDKVYPDLKFEGPAEKLFIPDTIPHDSFSSLEQRKTWYRLSRYGSMRKHNSGDEDNYVSISWAQSQIRLETLKIVQRWMEEDRISGRVVLGGGGKDGSLFGWNDPKAAPVPLASVFAAKRAKKKLQAPEATVPVPEVPREWPKDLVKTRSTSQARSPSKQRRRSSARSTKESDDTKPNVQFPVASFGWGAGSQSESPLPGPASKPIPSPPSWSTPRQSTSSIPPRPLSTSFTHTPTMPAEQKPVDTDGPNTLPPITKTSAPSLPPNPAITTSLSGDSDDDWGEMVSSPVVTAPPAPPPWRGLTHKKSQSLIGGPVPPSKATLIDTRPPTFPSVPSHRPTASLDQILVPKTRSNMRSTPGISSMNTSTSNTAIPTTTKFSPTATPAVTTVANGNYDPWASADFSFFERAPPQPKPASPPKHKPASKSVSFGGSFPEPLRRNGGKSRQEIEQDRIVADIIKGLPDLSYMLRR